MAAIARNHMRTEIMGRDDAAIHMLELDEPLELNRPRVPRRAVGVVTLRRLHHATANAEQNERRALTPENFRTLLEHAAAWFYRERFNGGARREETVVSVLVEGRATQIRDGARVFEDGQQGRITLRSDFERVSGGERGLAQHLVETINELFQTYLNRYVQGQMEQDGEGNRFFATWAGGRVQITALQPALARESRIAGGVVRYVPESKEGREARAWGRSVRQRFGRRLTRRRWSLGSTPEGSPYGCFRTALGQALDFRGGKMPDQVTAATTRAFRNNGLPGLLRWAWRKVKARVPEEGQEALMELWLQERPLTVEEVNRIVKATGVRISVHDLEHTLRNPGRGRWVSMRRVRAAGRLTQLYPPLDYYHREELPVPPPEEVLHFLQIDAEHAQPEEKEPLTQLVHMEFVFDPDTLDNVVCNQCGEEHSPQEMAAQRRYCLKCLKSCMAVCFEAHVRECRGLSNRVCSDCCQLLREDLRNHRCPVADVPNASVDAVFTRLAEGGVFDRNPELRRIMTDNQSSWVVTKPRPSKWGGLMDGSSDYRECVYFFDIESAQGASQVDEKAEEYKETRAHEPALICYKQMGGEMAHTEGRACVATFWDHLEEQACARVKRRWTGLGDLGAFALTAEAFRAQVEEWGWARVRLHDRQLHTRAEVKVADSPPLLSYVFGHNASGYDIPLMLPHLLEHPLVKRAWVRPSAMSTTRYRGLQVGLVEFRCSALNFPAPLFKFGRGFNVPVEKGFCPHTEFTPARVFDDADDSWFTRTGQHLPTFNGQEGSQTEKEFWSRMGPKAYWLHYCELDVVVLEKAMTAYWEQSWQLLGRLPGLDHYALASTVTNAALERYMNVPKLVKGEEKEDGWVYQHDGAPLLIQKRFSEYERRMNWRSLVGGRVGPMVAYYKCAPGELGASVDVCSLYPDRGSYARFPTGIGHTMVYRRGLTGGRLGEDEYRELRRNFPDCMIRVDGQFVPGSAPISPLVQKLRDPRTPEERLPGHTPTIYPTGKGTVVEGSVWSCELDWVLAHGGHIRSIRSWTVWLTSKEGPWKEFNDSVAKEKFLNSQLPDGVSTEEFLAGLRDQHSLPEDAVLEHRPNKAMRSTAKFQMNMNWGGFCVRDTDNTDFVQDAELGDYIADLLYGKDLKTKLDRFDRAVRAPVRVMPGWWHVSSAKERSRRQETMTTVPMHWGAVMLAQARLKLVDAGYQLMRAGFKLLYCDTDSWYVVVPLRRAVVDPLWRAYAQGREEALREWRQLRPVVVETFAAAGMPIGWRLGAWTLEKVFHRFVASRGKAYILDQVICVESEADFAVDTPEKATVSGAPRTLVGHNARALNFSSMLALVRAHVIGGAAGKNCALQPLLLDRLATMPRQLEQHSYRLQCPGTETAMDRLVPGPGAQGPASIKMELVFSMASFPKSRWLKPDHPSGNILGAPHVVFAFTKKEEGREFQVVRWYPDGNPRGQHRESRRELEV